jgi:hypothetical protein
MKQYTVLFALLVALIGCSTPKPSTIPTPIPESSSVSKAVVVHTVVSSCPQCHANVSVSVDNAKANGGRRENDAIVEDFSTQSACPSCGHKLKIEWHRRSATVVQGVEVQN